MPISKIKSGGVDLDNLEIGGTEAAKMPVGTTAQREGSPKKGDIRFNDTFDLMEYYTGNVWKSIDSPPTVTSISPTNFDAVNDTITVTGTGFQSGAAVTCVGTNGALFACTTSFVSDTSVTFVPTSAMVSDSGANDKFSIRVTNVSGLVSADLSEALDFAASPTFTTAAGSLGNIYDLERGTKTFTIAATGADSDDTLSFAVTAGSLPSNMSMSTSGVISGTPTQLSAGASTTSTFTVTCTATSGEDSSLTKTNTRQFSITVKGLIEQTFSYVSNAMQDWTTPSDLTLATVEMWGGAGASYNSSNQGTGTGGAGGYAKSTINILPSERGVAWKIVVAEGGGHWAGGYGGGGSGGNGGGGGGGASFLLAPSINLSADPFSTTATYSGFSAPTTEFLGKSMASEVVLIAGGGGGTQWYLNSGRNGGIGGGLTGGTGGSNQPGGTQTAGGTSVGNAVSGSKFAGGHVTTAPGSGGSGGAGGGFYGGGTKMQNNANNSGGGGSSFVGFADGSTSTVLTATGSYGTYVDSTTRTNGTRTYTNSDTTRQAETGRTPYQYNSTYYDQNPADDGGMHVAQGGAVNGVDHGGNGFVSIRY